MKQIRINSKIAVLTAMTTIALFSLIAIQSCKKEDSNTDLCNGVSCLNGGNCINGICNCPTGYTGVHCENKAVTSIILNNNTFTPITINHNSIIQTIPVGSSITYTGNYGDAFSSTATTFGKTSTGTQIGYAYNWTTTDYFPSSGNKTEELDVDIDAFFLKIQNNSTTPIIKLYIDYGLSDEHIENISIPNDGVVYNIGYYPSSTVNVRGENGTIHWSWNSITLPATKNQSKILVAN